MQYRGFEIKQMKYENSSHSSCFYIFKNSNVYSFFALNSIQAGKNVIDTYLRYNTDFKEPEVIMQPTIEPYVVNYVREVGLSEHEKIIEKINS
jgi:hypothetical protein